MRAAFPGGRSRGRFYACRAANHVVRKGEPLDLFVDDLVVGRLERLSRDGGPRLVFDGEADPIDIAMVRAQRAALQARLDELAAMFTEGAIDGSQLRSGTAQFRSQAALLDAQLATAVALTRSPRSPRTARTGSRRTGRRPRRTSAAR